MLQNVASDQGLHCLLYIQEFCMKQKKQKNYKNQQDTLWKGHVQRVEVAESIQSKWFMNYKQSHETKICYLWDLLNYDHLISTAILDHRSAFVK